MNNYDAVLDFGSKNLRLGIFDQSLKNIWVQLSWGGLVQNQTWKPFEPKSQKTIEKPSNNNWKTKTNQRKTHQKP